MRNLTFRTSHLNFAWRLVWITRPMPSITTRSTWLLIMASANDRVILLEKFTNVRFIVIGVKVNTYLQPARQKQNKMQTKKKSIFFKAGQGFAYNFGNIEYTFIAWFLLFYCFTYISVITRDRGMDWLGRNPSPTDDPPPMRNSSLCWSTPLVLTATPIHCT